MQDLKHLHLAPLQDNPCLDAVYESDGSLLYLDFKKNLGEANINITKDGASSIYNEDLTIFDGLVKSFQFEAGSNGTYYITITTDEGLALQGELCID